MSVPTLAGQQPDRAWFARPGIDVARDLLGAHLTRRDPGGDVTVRITEVEAYQGEQDPGSHAFRGPSPRNQVMFGEPGRLYVYRHLGLHTCMNIVCGPDCKAAAVLLRAGEVVAGEPVARRRRLAAGAVTRSVDLARGPARLTVALGVTMTDYGLDLLDPDSALSLEVATASGTGWRLPDDAVSSGPRVGVSGAGGEGALFPWRLWITGDPAVSAYRAAAAPRSRSGPRSR
ncbi:DNA-3-methyladenine glycosylase [Sanguibacter gelidistatuariae]|uniref:DNA-3-methyladenine glycosylase n=1 Tax=Sanguibacter gelidistatuariae TaxID=1814289 RepID=UPI000B814425|nr:DNA-3-methyladenine glycosylase [Sanguibacter gelidistatuariae]